MTHLISKFCPVGETLLDFCMWTRWTVIAFSLTAKHFKCFGCLRERFMSFKVNALYLISVGASYSQKWLIHRWEQEDSRSRGAVPTMEGSAKRDPTEGLIASTTVTSCCAGLPEPHCLHVFTMFRGQGFVISMEACPVHCMEWKWLSRLISFDVRSLLSPKFSVYGVHIKQSIFAYLQARMSCSANQEFTDGK